MHLKTKSTIFFNQNFNPVCNDNMIFECLQAVAIIRPPGKSAYLKIILLIFWCKTYVVVLKRTVSMRRFFWAPKTHVKTDVLGHIHNYMLIFCLSGPMHHVESKKITIFNSMPPGKFFMFFVVYYFFQNQLFRKKKSGVPSECLLDWIQIKPDVNAFWIRFGYKQVKYARIMITHFVFHSTYTVGVPLKMLNAQHSDLVFKPLPHDPENAW